METESEQPPRHLFTHSIQRLAMRIPTAAMASSANTGPHERGPVRPPRVLPANEPAKLQHAGTYRQIRYHPADAPGTDKGRGRWATEGGKRDKEKSKQQQAKKHRTTPSANRTTPRDRSRTRRSSRGRAERRVRARLRVIVVHLAERGVPGNAPFPSFDLNNVRSAIPTGGIVCGLLVLAAAWSEGSSSSPSDGRRPRSI